MTEILRRAAVAVLLLAAAPALAAQPPAPEQVVAGFHDVLVQGMKRADELGTGGRFDLFLPEVKRRFNIPLMIAIASGRHWRQATAEQKEQLADAFARFTAANYASRFDGFDGERFATRQTRPGPRETMLVETRIERPAKDPVEITYVLRQNDDWRVVDILLENGISELAVKRSEYRDILAREGVDGLIRALRDKAEALLTEDGG